MNRQVSRVSTAGAIVAILTIAGTALHADRVKMRSGQVVNGDFMSADVKMVRVLLPNGAVAQIPVEDISALEFTPRKAPPAPVAAPNPSVAPKPVTVPAKTMLNVLLTEAIDVDAAKAGATYKAILDDPVMMEGRVVVPRNTVVALQAVKVAQAGTVKGADKITLKANSLAFGGRKYEIVTAYVEQKGAGEGKKSGRKIAGGAGLGAVIGGIAGGGKGAAIGAAIGGGTGAVVASQGTEHLKLPAETRLQFQLTAAVNVNP
jgi:hypothetical protein